MRRLALAAACWAALAPLEGQTPLAPLEGQASSARVAALGGASLGLDGGDGWELDPSALAEAPAALSLRADEALLPADLQRQSLGLLWPQATGMLGLRLAHTSYGSLDGRDENGVATGSFQPWRLSGGLGWGWSASPVWDLGTQVLLLQQDLGGESVSATMLGLGARWHWGPGQSLGLAWQGISGDAMERVALGAGGSVGPGWRYALQAQGEQDLAVWALSAGAERWLGPLALRLGWAQGQGDSQDALSGLSSGVGLRWQQWALDYAALWGGGLGLQQRLSLAWSAAPSAPAAAAALEPPGDFDAPAPPQEALTPELNPAPAPTPAPTPALQLEFKLPDGGAADQGLAAEQAGRPDEALQQYLAAVKADPADTRAWLALGQLYLDQGRKASAIQCFEQAQRLEPGDKDLKAKVEALKAAP